MHVCIDICIYIIYIYIYTCIHIHIYTYDPPQPREAPPAATASVWRRPGADDTIYCNILCCNTIYYKIRMLMIMIMIMIYINIYIYREGEI